MVVGTSAAVIIPKDELKKHKLRLGDFVDVTIAKASKRKTMPGPLVDPEVIAWTNEFIDSYRPLLKKLAKS